jgi:hypothetical protein
MPPIFLGKLILLANYYIPRCGMGIPKMSALATLVVAVTHEFNYSVVLIAQKVPVTLDEVFHVGS